MLDANVVCMNGTVFVGGGLAGGIDRDGARLYSFRPGVDSTWTVTDTPTRVYAFTEHESQLLLVGGEEYPSLEKTNKVFTLRDGEFVETLPPMREKRSRSSAVSSGSELVVAGGLGSTGELSSVEMFRDGRWTTGPSLPTRGSYMKSALPERHVVSDSTEWKSVQYIYTFPSVQRKPVTMGDTTRHSKQMVSCCFFWWQSIVYWRFYINSLCICH